MNSEASRKSRCEENVSDSCNYSFKEEECIRYTPNQKRLKLDYCAAAAEHCAMVVGNHSQMLPDGHCQAYNCGMRHTQFVPRQQYLTEETFLKKHHPKCLSRRVSFCSIASDDLHLPTDTSSLAEENNFGSKENTIPGAVQPQLRSYQLIGDSLLLRFAEQILHMEAKIVDGARCIGLCVSGQKMIDLLHKVELELYPVGDKIILLIGTNDILQETDVSQMHRTMTSLLKQLCKRATRIVLLTLPPIPKIQLRPDHWEKIEGFNTFIRSLEDDSITVADISQLYVTKPKTCKMELFEKYYYDGDRKDLIHLNKLGLTDIYTYLTDNNYLI